MLARSRRAPARTATASLFIAWALLFAHPTSAQERLVIPIDEALALRLLSLPPHPQDPAQVGWRAAASAGASGSYHSVDDRAGAAEQLWGSAQGGLWGGWGRAHGKAWLAFSPAQGANPQFLARTTTLPLRFGLTSAADAKVGSDLGVYGTLRLDAGYEGQGPSTSALLGSAGDSAVSMAGAAPFGVVSARADVGGFNIDAHGIEHRWLRADLSARLLHHAQATAPTARATEYGVGFSVYGQRRQEAAWRDNTLLVQGQPLADAGSHDRSFDVLPVRFIRLDFADGIRPSQQVIDLRLAQGESLLHTPRATISARAHLGWRLVNDGQRISDNLTVIAALAVSVDTSSWGFALTGSRDAAPGADSAGVIAQDLLRARASLHPPSWPVALDVIGDYARLSDMEVDVSGTDDERPNARRGAVRAALTWTAWAPWRVTAAWTSGFGPAPDPALWRPWALASQRFDEATLSISWQLFDLDEDLSP
jgi:hypothetical protein